MRVRAFAHVPLAAYSESGSEFAAAKQPFQIGVEIHSPEALRAGDFSFTGISIETDIFLSSAEPRFRLTFLGAVPRTFTTLKEILNSTSEINVLDCLDVLLSAASYWVNTYLGKSGVTIGQILELAGLLVEIEETTKYKTARTSLAEMQKKSAGDLALDFVFAALEALSESNEPLMKLPGGGGVSIVKRGGEYGLRLATRLTLTAGSNENGNRRAAVDLCLGQWLQGESDENNWVKRCGGDAGDVGLFVFLLKAEGQQRSFSPRLELNGVGLDFRGAGDGLLFDLNGYTLRSAALRTQARFGPDISLGFAIHLNQCGFPVGPSFEAAQNRGGNAVAKSLLASGEAQPGSDSKSAVNPAFSAKACYISGKDALLELYDPEGKSTDLIWFPMQRRFGPLDCNKVGLRIRVTGEAKNDPILGIVFDGGVKLPALDVRLDQLAANVHLKRIADVSGYDLDLQGMSVSFKSNAVSLSGGLFKKREADGSIAYDGEALLKFKDLTISAIGSFSSPAGIGTSMFIFAILSKPLGGPAFFFVTGLAAGFGFNRGLRLPAPSDVTKFPLLTDIGNASYDNAHALQDLRAGNWIPAVRGEYWLAAGVNFTTFRLLNTSALLVVQFGKELTISVIGISTLRQPQSGRAYVYAQLGLTAVFKPERGEFMAAALLLPGSYVLTEEAHLTGGFALAAWFSPSSHAGDFVYTIGGYHPAFIVPDHYPRVPRLGINWHISSKIEMVGEAYFAITPSAMMAGGALQVTFSAGPLNAWLKARIDAIVFWKPFYVMVDASISVGVSFHIHVLFVDVTISAEIGAQFSFFGPPVGFLVHVDWYIISFTISHGDRGSRPELNWESFKEMLPASKPARAAKLPMSGLPFEDADHSLTADPPVPPPSPYIAINANDAGLQAKHSLDAGIDLWLVRPADFRFTATSAAPSTSVVVGSEERSVIPGVAVTPRRIAGTYSSTLTVTILRLGIEVGAAEIRKCLAESLPSDCGGRRSGCSRPETDMRGWDRQTTSGNIPSAMWKLPGEQDEVDINAPSTVTATGGITMHPLPPAVVNCTPQMEISVVFADRTIFDDADEWWLPISQKTVPVANNSVVAAAFLKIAQVNSSAVADSRTRLVAALTRFGVAGLTNGPLIKMAADPGSDFADEPREGSVVDHPKGAAA